MKRLNKNEGFSPVEVLIAMGILSIGIMAVVRLFPAGLAFSREAQEKTAAGFGLGFEIIATDGTARFLTGRGFTVRRINKVHEGRPHVVDAMINRGIQLVVNTPVGRDSAIDDAYIRRTAVRYQVPCITTLSGALAAVDGIAALKQGGLAVRSLQELGARLPRIPNAAFLPSPEAASLTVRAE